MKCNFYGCQLESRHAGMHMCITNKFKTRTHVLYEKCKVARSNEAVISNSPSKSRKDTRIDHTTIKYDLIHQRLLQMKKEIDDLLSAL